MQIIPVQQQTNGSDCGVFAAAFATSVLHCIPPETVPFDTSQIRKHLYDCLKSGIMQPFPVTDSYFHLPLHCKWFCSSINDFKMIGFKQNA